MRRSLGFARPIGLLLCLLVLANVASAAKKDRRDPFKGFDAWVEEIMEETDDAELRTRLVLTQRLLDFARDELEMPSGGSYELYADIGRDHLVWVVYAAPELSLEPKDWWYPVVGRQDYRGYFREDLARAEAGRLEARGYETGRVHVSGPDPSSWLFPAN